MSVHTLYRRDGTVAAVTVVDDCDDDLFEQFRYHFANGYAKRTQPRGIDWREHQQKVSLHTDILQRMGNPPGTYECGDHVNGDELDNRRENLRATTFMVNTHNVRKGCRTGRPKVLPDAEPRPCVECGTIFTPERWLADRQLCSRDCNAQLQVRRIAEGRRQARDARLQDR